MGFSMEKLSFVVKKNINCLVLTLYLQDIALHMLCHKKKEEKKKKKRDVFSIKFQTHTHKSLSLAGKAT